MKYNDHEFDPVTDEERAAREREEELARRIRREVLRVQSGEADEEIRADREREQAEEEARQEEQRKEERRRSNIFWLLFSGNILVRKGASEYYRYMICIAAMFFVSIFVMFTALHLDMKYSRLYREVQMLRERSLPFVPSLGKNSASENVAAGILDTAQIESAVREAASSIPAIKTVILFGSYARGEARADSDIDLRLEVDREQGFGLFALSAFGEAVRKETGRQIDLVSSDYLDDDLASVIEREGVIIYDRA